MSNEQVIVYLRAIRAKGLTYKEAEAVAWAIAKIMRLTDGGRE